jgi:hypothetical protein
MQMSNQEISLIEDILKMNEHKLGPDLSGLVTDLISELRTARFESDIAVESNRHFYQKFYGGDIDKMVADNKDLIRKNKKRRRA